VIRPRMSLERARKAADEICRRERLLEPYSPTGRQVAFKILVAQIRVNGAADPWGLKRIREPREEK
jgi:hypothetical protein